MSQKKLLNKIIEILTDAINSRVIEEELDKNGEVTYSTSRLMTTKETLEFITKKLKCLSEDLKND